MALTLQTGAAGFWGRHALRLLLALVLVSQVRTQYYSGYGTGPINNVVFRQPLPVLREKYRAAIAAGQLSSLMFGDTVGQSQVIRDVEPKYKYYPPNFPTRSGAASLVLGPYVADQQSPSPFSSLQVTGRPPAEQPPILDQRRLEEGQLPPTIDHTIAEDVIFQR